MERYKCDEEYWLTTSYRFGSEVSDVANRLLALKGEKRELIGAGVNAGRTGTTAIVCRTNASVLSTSIALADYGKSIYFVGGIASYRFKKIIDAYYLYSGNRSLISDTFYSSFDSFDSIENYANESYDSELKQVCKLVKKHGSNIVQMVDTATKRAASRSDEADVNLGTAHKVKGLEFGTVALEEDFIDLTSMKSDRHRNTEEEINLLYVGCTRAKSKLYPSKKLTKWLNTSFCRI